MGLNKNIIAATITVFLLFITASLLGQEESGSSPKKKKINPAALLPWPPVLPGNSDVVTDSTAEFLLLPATMQMRGGVRIATAIPKIDFFYLQGQTHWSKLWSVWGDGSTAGNTYYTSIGDHNNPRGIAQVYEYDANRRKQRLLMNVRDYLEQSGSLPKQMDYTPGKIHGRTEMGADGWLYFSTHRGSTRDNTTDARGYRGDWIFRVNPGSGKKEIVAAYPMPKHTIPASVLDPQRMMFYGGTAPGNDATDKGSWFIAYDIKNRKLVKKAANGFDRYAIFSKSTGRVFWQSDVSAEEAKRGKKPQGYRYDPVTNEISSSQSVPAVRAATHENRSGVVYGFTQGDTRLWAFNTKTEQTEYIGEAMVGTQSYVTSVDIDPVNERYLYYVPGAHGGSKQDGSAVVQFDLKTKTRKIIAFINPFYLSKYGYSADGTFSTALNADGSMLFITWNGTRVKGAKDWDTVAVTVIHIPTSERAN